MNASVARASVARAARALLPTRPALRLRRTAAAVLCALLAAGCAGKQGAPEAPGPERIPDLRAEVEENPDAVQPRVRLGAALRAADSLQSARRVLEEARRLDPRAPAAALFLGLTYEDLESFEEARQVYEDYLEVSEADELRGRIEQRLAYLDRRAVQASVREAVSREGELADRPPEEGTVAVLPFLYQGASEDLRPLSRALSAFLVTDLAQTDRVRVLERMRVQLLMDELELAETRYVDPSTAARSGRLLGAAHMVAGRLGGDRDRLSVEASLVNVPEGAEGTRQVMSDQQSAEQIFEMEDRIALSVYDALGIELTPAQRQRVTDDPTDSFDALLAYGRGLSAADSANFGQAAEHFQQALELDPDFEAAQQEAETASDLSAASEVDTDELAQAAAGEGEEPEIETADAQTILETSVTTLPGPADRDPVVETLGVEGASPTVLIRILIPTPGGGQ